MMLYIAELCKCHPCFGHKVKICYCKCKSCQGLKVMHKHGLVIWSQYANANVNCVKGLKRLGVI